MFSWSFVCFLGHLNTYIPSSSERMWHGEITGKICEISSDPAQIEHVSLALKGDVRYMSFMGDGSPIEPLTGIGRHPFANVGCKKNKQKNEHMTSIFNISYLNISDLCGKPKPPRAFFVDMGCAAYDETDAKPGGVSSSIPLFSNMYSKSCVTFDKIFAWEARSYPTWWSKVPDRMRSKIEFHNFKVDANQVQTLLKQFQPSDFVTVKLDIDHTETELEVVTVLEKHAHLIDELFFEYHYYFDGLDFGWGHKVKHSKHNATSAIQLMTHLRKKGIRAHFWI